MATVTMVGGSARLAGARRLSGKLLSVAITLAGLLLLTFLMGRLLPADPVLAVTGSEVDKATYDRVYQQLGLDLPIWQQFLSYVKNVLTGNL